MLDAHVHIWEPQRFEYPWLAAHPSLRTSMTLAEYRGPAGDIVLVEAGCARHQAVAEARWLGEVASDWPGAAGVVAGGDLRDARVEAHLDALHDVPFLVGIRHNLQAESCRQLTDRSLLRGLRLLAERGLVFDACIRAEQLGPLISLLGALPDLAVVVDHLGNPPLREGLMSPEGQRWANGMRVLAAMPRVFVKLSGLSPAGGFPAYQARAGEYLRWIIDGYGPERVLWGSDWPVSAYLGAEASPETWQAFVRVATGLSDSDWQQVSATTGRHVYGIR